MSIIRDLTIKIQKYLQEDELIILVGARQVGKTTILHQLKEMLKKQGETCYFLNLEDPDYLGLLNQSPKNLWQIFPFDLTKKTYLLADEVQYLDNPTNFLKYLYDQYKGKLKIIASGSSAFYLDKKFKDSLAGRKRLFSVLTLSFPEFLRFKGEDGLASGNFSKLTLSEKEKVNFYYQEYLTFGGYPRVVLAATTEKEAVLEELAYSYIKKDVYEAGVRHDEIFYRLLKILASQIGNLVNASELSATLGVSKTAIDNYLYVMQKSFHLALIKPFFRNLRKELTKMPKVYFLDLGLRNFLVRNFKPYLSREDQGALLENALFRQLLSKHSIEEITFWRTVTGQEVDFIVRGGMALEVKKQPENFRPTQYKAFLKNYPQIKLSLVTLNKKIAQVYKQKVYDLWEVGNP